MVTLTVPAGGWDGLVGEPPLPQAAAMATPPIARNRDSDILSLRSTGVEAKHLHLTRDEHLGVVLDCFGEAYAPTTIADDRRGTGNTKAVKNAEPPPSSAPAAAISAKWPDESGSTSTPAIAR